MSATRPQSRRERNRSSISGISLGYRSLERTICLRASKRLLKVWKNSSWVLLARDELDVIHQQHVDVAVPAAHINHLVVPDAVNDLVGELLGRHVRDPEICMLENVIAYCVHEMRLPEPHASIDQKRVVRGSRRLSNLHTCGSSQLVVGRSNEIFEGISHVDLSRSSSPQSSRAPWPVNVLAGRGFRLCFWF